MSLSCTCGDDDGFAWYFTSKDDFSTLLTKRSRKCCSCGTKIKPGDDCVKFGRYKVADSEVEERIYGYRGEVPLASWYMCEECGGVYLSVTELGMCFDLDGDIREQVREMNHDGGLK